MQQCKESLDDGEEDAFKDFIGAYSILVEMGQLLEKSGSWRPMVSQGPFKLCLTTKMVDRSWASMKTLYGKKPQHDVEGSAFGLDLPYVEERRDMWLVGTAVTTVEVVEYKCQHPDCPNRDKCNKDRAYSGDGDDIVVFSKMVGVEPLPEY